MRTKTKKLFIGLATALSFATVASNINFITPTASAKANHTKKKHSNKKPVNNQSTFNKLYSNDAASNSIKQRLIDSINNRRNKNGRSSFTISSNLSKLAAERARLYSSYDEGAELFKTYTADNRSAGSLQGAYIDGVQMGIFPDDTTNSQSISDSIYEDTLASGIGNNGQIKYTDIVNASSYLFSEIYGGGAVFGNVGNGQNYAGIGVYIYQGYVYADIITSDTNY